MESTVIPVLGKGQVRVAGRRSLLRATPALSFPALLEILGLEKLLLIYCTFFWIYWDINFMHWIFHDLDFKIQHPSTLAFLLLSPPPHLKYGLGHEFQGLFWNSKAKNGLFVLLYPPSLPRGRASNALAASWWGEGLKDNIHIGLHCKIEKKKKRTCCIRAVYLQKSESTRGNNLVTLLSLGTEFIWAYLVGVGWGGVMVVGWIDSHNPNCRSIIFQGERWQWGKKLFGLSELRHGALGGI